MKTSAASLVKDYIDSCSIVGQGVIVHHNTSKGVKALLQAAVQRQQSQPHESDDTFCEIEILWKYLIHLSCR